MAKKTPQARKPVVGKAGPKPSAKPAPKPTAKPAAKSVVKATKPAPKAAAKPVTKAVAKAPAKVPAKAATKPVKVEAKPVVKAAPAAKVVPAKAPVAPKAGTKAVPAAKVAAKPAGKGAPAAPAAKAPIDDKKGGRKGITVVDPKAAAPKKPKPSKEKIVSVAPPSVGRLLDPKNPVRRPLIPSGPKAAHIRPLGMQGPEEERPLMSGKSPFNKKELAHFRQVLIRKRAELVGDVSQMESEALQGNSGTTSVPQHMAEQGSDTYDQSLALDIAAADRKLIKEIDDAIKRIDGGTFGICELTGKPIKLERLEELPWARYSIEAARELERRSMWA